MKIYSLKGVKEVGLRFFKSSRFLIVSVVAFSLLSSACSKKKDKDTEVLPTVSGDVGFDLPLYALTGKTFEMNAVGVTEPTEGLSYQWVCKGIRKDTVKVSNIKITIPDSLATYTVSLTVSADNYYGRTVSKQITSVKPGWNGSVTNLPQPKDSILDERDNQWYYIVDAGNLQWFSENLNWAGAGQAYARADAAGDVFGRLYTWNDATGGVSASGLGQGVQGVCPSGWTVPTNEDWADLAKAVSASKEDSFLSNWSGLANKLMVNAYFNDAVMWPYSPNVNITNDIAWNAIPAGNSSFDYYQFKNLFSYGFWWSSTEKNSTSAYYRYIYYDYPDFPFNSADKDALGASVRCVRIKNLTN